MAHDVICVKKYLLPPIDFWWHKTCKKDVVGIATFGPIGLFLTNNIIINLQWHTGVYEETFDVNIKIAQTN